MPKGSFRPQRRRATLARSLLWFGIGFGLVELLGRGRAAGLIGRRRGRGRNLPRLGGARGRSRSSRSHDGAARVVTAITIDRSPQELYDAWRDLERLPTFMRHLESVTVTGEGRSRWVAKGPAGTNVAWDAEIVEDRPGELIAWRSIAGADAGAESSGEVRFERAPGGRGTVVRVSIEHRPPGGALGARVATLLRESPERQVPADLRRFKQLMEAGDIVTTEGQPAARRRSTSRLFDDAVR